MNSISSRLSKTTAILLGVAALTLTIDLLLAPRWGFHPIFAYFLSINVAAFFAYAYDKWAASRDARRISEASLHLIGALGGTPAAFLAQLCFRHKTRKRSFRIRFWLIALGQVIALFAWIGLSGHYLR